MEAASRKSAWLSGQHRTSDSSLRSGESTWRTPLNQLQQFGRFESRPPPPQHLGRRRGPELLSPDTSLHGSFEFSVYANRESELLTERTGDTDAGKLAYSGRMRARQKALNLCKSALRVEEISESIAEGYREVYVKNRAN